ncbi:hypothetical protein JXA47_12895 [Candidatus Sumerlaeota bacterium]|nr:hypothetical protein [Candidatus Sumerlaeota bacterium]
MKRLALLLIPLTLAAALLACRTVEIERDDPWWHPTLPLDAVAWPWPSGDLPMIDYHDAHGAGWWDVPWVLAEQIVMLPSCATWALGEITYTELLGGGYSYDHSQWQWRVANWTFVVPHVIFTGAGVAVNTVADTLVHDPVAWLGWWRKG